MVDNSGNNSIQSISANSKVMKILLILTAVFLIFAGPTYVSYLLSEILNLNYLVSITVGFSLFLFGLFLLYYLIKNKFVT
jgi:hypothetical protein